MQQPWYYFWRSVDTVLNCQDYWTLYVLCAECGAGDDVVETVCIFDDNLMSFDFINEILTQMAVNGFSL